MTTPHSAAPSELHPFPSFAALSQSAPQQILESATLTAEATESAPILDGRTTLTPRTDIGFKIIPSPLRLEVKCHGVVSDADDTIFTGSGEHLHDGPYGRFAMAVSRLIDKELAHDRDQKLDQYPGLCEVAHIRDSRPERGASYFTKELWAEFRAKTGGPEPEVIESIRLLAKERLGCICESETFIDLIKAEVKNHFLAMAQRGVEADDGLRHAFASAVQEEVKIAVCSASGKEVIHRALAQYGFCPNEDSNGQFATIVCSAEKKTTKGYSGKGFSEAAKQMNLDPINLVAVGDSMSDVMGALLAGYGTIVIRTPIDKIEQKEWESLQAGLKTNLEKHNLPYPPDFTPALYLMQSFSELRVGNCGTKQAYSFARQPVAQ